MEKENGRNINSHQNVIMLTWSKVLEVFRFMTVKHNNIKYKIKYIKTHLHIIALSIGYDYKSPKLS